MKKAYKITALLLIVVLFTCGCYDALDINKKHIVTAVILDYADDQVHFYVEIADIEAQSADKNDKYKYAVGMGDGIMESKEDLNRSLDRQLYLSAIRTIIFTDSFVNKYITEYLNRLRASEQYNKKVIIATTKQSPQELIEECQNEKISLGFTVDELLTSLQKQGETFIRTSEEVIERLSNEHAAILLPLIKFGEFSNILCGYTVVDKNVIKGYIPPSRARACVLMNRKKSKSHYYIEYQGQSLSVEGEIKNFKIKPKYDNEEVSFTVDCQMKASLLYSDSKPQYAFEISDFKNMETQLKKDVKEDISNAIKTAQHELGCDYLNFDDAFRIKYPHVFEQLNWKEEFTNAAVEVDVTVNLDSVWLMDYED